MCVLAFSTVILLLCKITNFLSQHCKYVCVWVFLCVCVYVRGSDCVFVGVAVVFQT